MVETPRLSITAAATHAARKKAHHLIRQGRMERDLGLPPGLSWSRFMKPFHQTPRPRVYLVAERETGMPIGVLLLWRPSPGAWPMMHYGFAEPFRGRGFGTEAVGAAVRTILDGDLAPGLGAVIAHANAASAKVALAAGLRPLHEQDGATLYGVAKDDAVEVWVRATELRPERPPRLAGWLDSRVRWVAFRAAAQLSMVPYLRKTIRWLLMSLG